MFVPAAWLLLLTVVEIDKWSMEEGVRWCFAGDTVSDLFRIQDTLNQHGYHSILQWYAIPAGLRLVPIICFSTGQWHNTRPGGVRSIWPKRRVMECCIRWSGLHNHPTSTQLRWFVISWTGEWRKSSQQVPIICGNSFKAVGKAFQVKLVERMPRLCKAVIKAKGGYFEKSQI